jgi:hypothetical protein
MYKECEIPEHQDAIERELMRAALSAFGKYDRSEFDSDERLVVKKIINVIVVVDKLRMKLLRKHDKDHPDNHLYHVDEIAIVASAYYVWINELDAESVNPCCFAGQQFRVFASAMVMVDAFSHLDSALECIHFGSSCDELASYLKHIKFPKPV